jgi:translation initiation factor 2 beta subunit (eIF-2beta)/eIF-5
MITGKYTGIVSAFQACKDCGEHDECFARMASDRVFEDRECRGWRPIGAVKISKEVLI